jgi:hypothetical protein
MPVFQFYVPAGLVKKRGGDKDRFANGVGRRVIKEIVSRRSLLSKCYTVLRYTLKCNFIYDHKKIS